MDYSEISKMKCTEINALPENKINEIIEVVIDYYYAKGFPYYEINPEKIKKEYNYLLNFNVSDLELPDNNLQQNMTGLNTVNSFHPEMWSVQCNKAKTPVEIFYDRTLFRNALRKRIKYSDTKLVDFNIRKSLKAFGTQAVSNFRPTIAKWVYQNFCPENGDVLDPCAGYGGRLFGAACSHIKSYTGVDPTAVTQTGNLRLAEELQYVAYANFPAIRLDALPFEDWDSVNKFDLVFTSPPYFNIEKYSNYGNQSYIRYPEYELWIKGFLRPLIEKSFGFLKQGGYLVLNVGKPIDKDTLDIGNEIFEQNPDVYWMRLSKFLGQGNKDSVSHKVEPLFVWRKLEEN
jgi:hypothetical protein